MIKIVIAAIVVVLLFGLLFKLLKIAIFVAIGLGLFLVARNFIGQKRIK